MANDPLPLILQAQAGDRESFGALFGQYKNLVYKTAYLTLGDRLDAEDIISTFPLETFKAWAEELVLVN